MKNLFRVLVVATVCVAGLTGCAALIAGGAAGAGAGTLAYMQGELKVELSASPGQTRKAIDDAIHRLELKQLEAEADQLSGDYLVLTGADEKVSIRYEKLKSRVTELSIRVGIFGNENLSRALLEEIRAGL